MEPHRKNEVLQLYSRIDELEQSLAKAGTKSERARIKRRLVSLREKVGRLLRPQNKQGIPSIYLSPEAERCGSGSKVEIANSFVEPNKSKTAPAASKAAALRSGEERRKKQPKKSKKRRGRVLYDVDDIARGHRLFGQIKALERRIKLEAAKYKEAAQDGRFYDIEVLKRLVPERADLEREYAKIPDPLGLLPPLVRAWPKKAGQQKGKAPKRSSDQVSSPAEAPKVPPSSVLPTRHLPWRVLPPGELSVNAVIQHYDGLQRQNPRIKYERERITKAFSLHPEQCYVGKDEFEGYIVFTFAHTPRALLECPVFGNAIYIIDSDWKRWSRMTKQELLARSHEVTRIIHRGDWFCKVKKELRVR